MFQYCGLQTHSYLTCDYKSQERSPPGKDANVVACISSLLFIAKQRLRNGIFTDVEMLLPKN
jgi:hypothetical protein